MDKQERQTFMYNYGVFYAGLGGTFGLYRDAEPAFAQARAFLPYSKLNFVDADFEAFERGFKSFQHLRTACQLELKRAQAENDGFLKRDDYKFENYMYDTSLPIPPKNHCDGCRQLIAECRGGKKCTPRD